MPKGFVALTLTTVMALASGKMILDEIKPNDYRSDDVSMFSLTKRFANEKLEPMTQEEVEELERPLIIEETNSMNNSNLRKPCQILHKMPTN